MTAMQEVLLVLTAEDHARLLRALQQIPGEEGSYLHWVVAKALPVSDLGQLSPPVSIREPLHRLELVANLDE